MKLVFKIRLNDVESIEKSRNHKYIKRFPKKNGKGWWYVYAKDLKKPFKALLTIFGLKDSNITNTYKDEKIEQNYGVTKENFASHILRYFTKKEFYDNKFSNPTISEKYKKPINENKSKTEKKDKKETKTTDKPKKKTTWNLSLIRKIWSIYNPETAKNNEIAFKDNDYKQVKVGERINESDVITYEVRAKEEQDEKDDVFSDLDKQVLAVALQKELDMNPLMNDYYYYEKLKGKYPELQAKGSIFGIMDELKNIDISKINMDEVIEHTKNLKEHGNKTAMLGNQNAKKFGIKPKSYNFLVEKFEDFNGDVLTEFGAVNPSFLQYAMLPDSTVDKQKDKIDVYNDLQNGQKKLNKNNLSDLIIDIYNDYKGVNDGNSQNNVERTGISERDRNLRGELTTSSTNDVSETRNGSEREELNITSNQSGIGLGEPETTSSGGTRRGRRTLSEIRKECLELLSTKKDDEFTEEDKKILAQYEGAGGLGEENSSASGTLYEYYTPQKVVDKVWQLVDKYLPQTNKTVIEPSAGIGKFANNRKEKFTLFELEEISSRISKILHPDVKVVQGEFQKNFVKNGMFTKKFEKFDVAVGNPPYGKYAGFYKGQGEGKEHTRYEEYFMDRTLDTLKDNGIMAFVVPSSFLRSGNSQKQMQL